ncbi:MAG: hypothetical protein HC924_12160 [Synechococcaceae cyanobacterium SM2_3_2]|nr:hypothetical protein [Synechococcaceae cyanobacterium SM2_3_2]
MIMGRWATGLVRAMVGLVSAIVLWALGWGGWGVQAQLFPTSPQSSAVETAGPEPVPVSPASAYPAQAPSPLSPSLVGIPAPSITLDSFCRQPPEAQARKEQLRQQSLESDAAWAAYTQVVGEHRLQLEQCRRSRWPQIQAVWLRLYPCDGNPGVLDQVFDQIVNLGYNRVFIETFYDGQSILPGQEGSPWPSVQPNQDLLEMALTLARRRGISAYAWVFSLNMGYSYSQLPDREGALARNGAGDTTILDPSTATLADLDDAVGPDQVFIDPYSPQARQDYLSLLSGILRRQPDGVLFDYIRYPRGTGASSVAGTVKDLWIYGESARAAFVGLGANPYSQDLLNRFLDQGYVTVNNLLELDSRYGPTDPSWRQPGDPLPSPDVPLSGPLAIEPLTVEPLETPFVFDLDGQTGSLASGASGTVQAELRRDPADKVEGFLPSTTPDLANSEGNDSALNPDQEAEESTPMPISDVATRQARVQSQLWPLAVSFAQQGILDFLDQISEPVQNQGIPAGAVFFPDGNARVGEMGYDSRLQPWERFKQGRERHPMAYALCEDASCVAEQVGRVLAATPPNTLVCPALAGLWGQALSNRPMLEVQMQTLQQSHPQLSCVSHFAYSWVSPESDRARKACQV